MQKKRLKIFSWAIIILLIIQIPFFLYLLNFRLIAFNEGYYKSEFKKYGVYGKFPDEDINRINFGLLHYLRYDKTGNLIDSDFFNQKEKEHLLDVKKLVQSTLFFFYFIILNMVILVIVLICLIKCQKFSIQSMTSGWKANVPAHRGKFLSMLKNHPDAVNGSNIPPICDVSEIAKRFLSTFKNLLIFDGWFLTNSFKKIKNNLIRFLSVSLVGGGILTLVHSFMFWYLVKADFGNLFAKFHQIFFKAGTWTFDSNIVILYPPEFFYDITYKIAFNTLIMAFMIIIAGISPYISVKIKKYINKTTKSQRR